MSEQNVQLFQKAYDAFNRRDVEANLALMDDDVEGVPRVAAIESSYHGHEGTRRWWKDLLDAFPDMTAEVGEVRELGDVTVGAVHLRGRGAGSDIPSDQRVWQVCRWRHGKCIWWGIFDAQDEALKAVGLGE
ncbi:MAG: nuclear transport factor 2 family protein [Actinobacteria bacterium]|nr:MAG: nuclear transport factor 2 family protein [Actinomycetota bacterium]